METKIPPVVEVVGAGAVQGKTNTSHWVSEAKAGVQLTLIDVCVTLETIVLVGFKQVGAGPQVTFAIQPGAVTEASLTKRKVRQPSGEDEVNEGRPVPVNVPQYPPASPPGTFPAPLELGICGAFTELPLYTYMASKLASSEKVVKVTVTISPGFVGQIVVVELVELA
jgi:hypothetical protein